MAVQKANCLVCGKPLVYWDEAQEVTCTFFQRNAECRRKECPYFPGANAEVKAAFQPHSA